MGTDKAVNEAVDIAVGGDAVGGHAVGDDAVGGHAVGDDAVGDDAVGDDAVGGGRIGRGRWSGTTDTVSPPVSPARVQNLELLLLVGAAAVTTAALVSVEIDQQRALTGALGYLGAAYLGLFAVAHLAVRRWARYADPVILPCVALLTGIGLVMIHRLDLGAAAAAAAAGDPVPSANAVRQAAGSVVLLVVVVGRLPDHRVLARYGYLCGLAGLILLVLPGVLPASISQVNGAKLWIRVGPVSLQPGEFAKLLIIVFAAALLVQMRELFRTAGRRVARMELPRARDLAPLLAAWLLPEIPSHGSACPTELEAGLGQAMIATLRHRLIRVPARLVRHAGTLTLRLPPGHHLLAEILARIRALPRPS